MPSTKSDKSQLVVTPGMISHIDAAFSLGCTYIENDPPEVVHYRPLDPQNASPKT